MFSATLSLTTMIASHPTPVFAGTSGTWVATGSMRTARLGHTATLLNSGLVLVAGGTTGAGGALASAELYDPATGQWTLTGSMSQGRAYHTATLLSGGEVLVTGGMGAGAAGAELYNPSSGQWFATGSMAAARSHHAAALLGDGEVLVAGGIGSSGAELATASTRRRGCTTARCWSPAARRRSARRPWPPPSSTIPEPPLGGR
jgi:N-acetylneuraminic acid mutarotase